MTKTTSFKEEFQKKILPEVTKTLNLKNVNASPAIKKVVINVGVGSYAQKDKNLEPVIEHLKAITGQKPVVNKSRKAISNFKLRIGMPVGISVTLRKDKMYDFLNKLINCVFPRVRDFRGISKKHLDGKGNLSVGFKEFTTFLEINPDDVERNHGIEVTIVTKAKNNEEGYVLLEKMGFPFKKEPVKS